MSAKLTAQRHYKKHTPLRANSKDHKADLEAISRASSPMLRADTLIAQRKDQKLDEKIEEMLEEQQGRRTRYRYDQEAVIGLEHLIDSPLDPHTQVPRWRDMLAATKGKTMSRAEFMRNARVILCQTSTHDPATMAS